VRLIQHRQQHKTTIHGSSDTSLARAKVPKSFATSTHHVIGFKSINTMGEISGVSTADIDNVDGFFTTQSGGGGGTATTTPTISANVSTFGSGTLTITNASSYTHPSYKVEIDAGGSTIIANTAIVKNRTNNVENGTITWGDSSSVSGTRTVRVRAQEFGDNIQSSEVTTTYTRGTITNRYIRIRGVNSNGTNSSSRLGIGDIEFWTGSARTGTLYPTTHLTSATSETGIEVSMGHTYSSTYANFKACDSSTNTFAWLLGSSATNNWWQIHFESGTYSTPPTIASIKFGARNNSANYISIKGSDTGAFAGEETDYGVYYTPGDNTTYNLG